MDLNNFAIQLIASFIACIGFSIMFQIKGLNILFAAIGGFLSWAAYLVAGVFSDNIYLCYLIAGLAISIYCEIMARVRHCPVTVFLVVAFIPLVPGALAYRTIIYFLERNLVSALVTCCEMLGMASCIALGVFLGSSIFNLKRIAYKKSK